MEQKLIPIRVATVVGAGAMGSGIAQVLAQAGVRVHLYDTKDEALERAMQKMQAMAENGVKTPSCATSPWKAPVRATATSRQNSKSAWTLSWPLLNARAIRAIS